MTRNDYSTPVFRDLGNVVIGTLGAFNGNLEVGMKKP